MRWILLSVGGALLLVAVAGLIGALLPRTHVAARAAIFHRPAREIFALVRDVAAAPSWRSNLQRVELLPPREDGYRYANADPVTGQAAWYDLKVRIVKCTPEEAGQDGGRTEPSFAPLTPPLQRPERHLRYGQWFRKGKGRKQ